MVWSMISFFDNHCTFRNRGGKNIIIEYLFHYLPDVVNFSIFFVKCEKNEIVSKVSNFCNWTNYDILRILSYDKFEVRPIKN